MPPKTRQGKQSSTSDDEHYDGPSDNVEFTASGSEQLVELAKTIKVLSNRVDELMSQPALSPPQPSLTAQEDYSAVYRRVKDALLVTGQLIVASN